MLVLFARRFPSQFLLLCWAYHLESCMLAAFPPTSRSIALQGLCKDVHMFLLYCDPFLVAQGVRGHTFCFVLVRALQTLDSHDMTVAQKHSFVGLQNSETSRASCTHEDCTDG